MPLFLTLCHIHRYFTIGFEMNGEPIDPSQTTSSILRRYWVDKPLAEVTYVSTDSVRITGAVIFEAYDKDVLLVSGKLQRLDNNFKWTMDCCARLVALCSSVDERLSEDPGVFLLLPWRSVVLVVVRGLV